MGEHLSALCLAKRVRPGFSDPGSGDVYKAERAFLDFVVDDLSLYDALARPYDLASVLWVDPPVEQERVMVIRRLLMVEPGDLPGGRVSLYICPECGDIGCGAITVRIERRGLEIIWSDFGYENNYENNVELESFCSIGPFHFDLNTYESKLRALLSA